MAVSLVQHWSPCASLITTTVQDSIDWLDINSERATEDLLAVEENEDEPTSLRPGEEARSLLCKECGKRFRGVSQAEFHASKTEHQDFEESTEEIAPLTEEEKIARLEE